MSVRKIENPEKFRTAVRDTLKVFLTEDKHCNNLEKGIHNWALKEANTRKVVKKWDNPYFVQIYVDHLRSIFVNLKNTDIVSQVKDGSIKSHTIAFMTHQELCPERWTELIEAKSKRDKTKFETNFEAATDTFKCRKCKGNKCTYYLQQVKAADEPCTIFINCLDCGNKWKTC